MAKVKPIELLVAKLLYMNIEYIYMLNILLLFRWCLFLSVFVMKKKKNTNTFSFIHSMFHQMKRAAYKSHTKKEQKESKMSYDENNECFLFHSSRYSSAVIIRVYSMLYVVCMI